MSLRWAVCSVRRCADRIQPAFVCTQVGRAALHPYYLPSSVSRRWKGQAATGSAGRFTAKLPPRNSKFDTLIWKLQKGLAEHSFQMVRDAYMDFLDFENRNPPTSYSPRPSQQEALKASIAFLTGLGQAELLDQILDLLCSRCGMPIGLEVHESVVNTFQEKGRLRSAYTWLMQMRSKAGMTVPTVHMWNQLIKKCRRNNVPEEFLRTPVACVRRSGCQLDEETYLAILEVLFIDHHHPPRPEQFQTVLLEMEKSGFLAPAVLKKVIREVTHHKMHAIASELEIKKAHLEGGEVVSHEARMNMMLLEHLGSGGDKKAAKLLKDLVRRGFQPDRDTFTVLSQGIRNMRSLSVWESLIGIKADSKVWETVIENAVDFRTAEDLYTTSLDRGIRPTPRMLEPLLRALCTEKWAPPSASRIDKAYQLLRQYVELTKSNPSDTSPAPKPDSHDPQSELPLYNVVLRALSASSERLEYLPQAASLLEELRDRGITMDSATRATHIILAMKCASGPQEAIDLYEVMKQSVSGEVLLDAKGFTAVLASFTKTFLVAPATLVFCLQILKDMRDAKLNTPVEAYSILLAQLGLLATEASGIELQTTLATSIKRVHNHISVEPSLRLDTVLWNHLMDAYQRVGCFRDALLIWDTLFISRQFDDASVSIIFDACSFAGAYDIAQRIFQKLERIGFVFNDRHWSNWIECLCRLGMVDDATKVFCLEMPRVGAKTTVQQAKVIIRFAQTRHEDGLVIDRMRRYLPEIYAQLH